MPIETFAHWLETGERGISSAAMVSHLTGVQVEPTSTNSDCPHDPSDLRRCELLLRAVPEARAHLSAMASRSAQWAALVEAWDELVQTAEAEHPHAFTSGARGSAPATYARMRELLDAVGRRR